MIAKVFAVLAAGAFFFAAQFSQGRIDATEEHRAVVEANPFGRMPPGRYMAEYAATMLMGGTRAIAIDYLWIQYGKAERAHQYIEMDAILTLLVALAPDLDEVRQHLAWNRAWNIAAQMDTKEERWIWVKSGIELNEESVMRSPTKSKLLFNKGYLLWQRLPQEQYFLDKYREMTGHDAFEVAAHTFRDALLLGHQTPPCDGMMQDAYFRWAHDLMSEGEFVKAIRVLEEGEKTYRQLMEGRPTGMTGKTNAAFGELAPAYRVERELSDALRAHRDTKEIESRLLQIYRAILKKYGSIKGVELRVIQLTGRPYAAAFRNARDGRGAQGADSLKAIIDIYTDLINGPYGEMPQWSDAVRFVQRVQAALRKDGQVPPAEAARMYDDILEEFRYNLPGDSLQMLELEKRSKELRPDKKGD